MREAHMSRVYGEPVSVQAQGGRQAGQVRVARRLYAVRAILEHWVVNREWWQNPETPGPRRGSLRQRTRGARA